MWPNSKRTPKIKASKSMMMRPPVRVFLINELLSQKVIYLTKQVPGHFQSRVSSTVPIKQRRSAVKTPGIQLSDDNILWFPPSVLIRFFSWLPCNCQLHEVAHWWRVVRKLYICVDRWGVGNCRYVNSIKAAGWPWSFLSQYLSFSEGELYI